MRLKYAPIFEKMEEIVSEKKLEYLSHLTEHLSQNDDRIRNEKEALIKMEKSFSELKPKLKHELEKQLENIKKLSEKDE